MVHIPILKIDVPEPSLLNIIPGTINAIIHVLSAVYELVDDAIRPLSPEAKAAYEQMVISSLPHEHRVLRKRIAEQKVTDMDQISDELEEATKSYYRRAMREGVSGYKEETAEDAAWRKLVSVDSASDRVQAAYEMRMESDAGPGPLLTPEELATLAVKQQELAAAEASEAAARQAAASSRDADDRLFVPSAARRVTVASTCAASGLAIGVGAVRLVHAILKRRKKPAKKARAAGTPPLPPGTSGSRPAGSQRRRTTGGASGKGGSKVASSRGSSGRATPRTQG